MTVLSEFYCIALPFCCVVVVVALPSIGVIVYVHSSCSAQIGEHKPCKGECCPSRSLLYVTRHQICIRHPYSTQSIYMFLQVHVSNNKQFVPEGIWMPCKVNTVSAPLVCTYREISRSVYMYTLFACRVIEE